MRFPRVSSLLLTVMVASCAAPPKPAPAPAPPPPPAAPAPLPPVEWRDLAETPGAWRYVAQVGNSAAQFEAANVTLFTLRCDRSTRRIAITRADAPGAALKITTSYGSRTLATPDLAASDTLLDQTAFSRGRFTIEATGHSELVLPAWAEPARVIEDCRG